MELADRLKLYIEHKGLNPNAIEREIGVGTGTIAKTISSGKSLNAETLRKLVLKYSDLNLDWLVIGKGEMLKPSPQTLSGEDPGEYTIQRKHTAPLPQSFTQATVSVTVEDTSGNQLITLVNDRAAAGWAQGFADPVFYSDLPQFAFPRHLLKPGGEYFVIETAGNSMSPAVKDRDLLLIRRLLNRYELRSGMVGVVLGVDGVQVKRFEPLPLGQLTLHADNPRYRPQTVQIGECIALFAVERRLTTELDNPLDTFYSYLDQFNNRLNRLENTPQNQPSHP